jgi:hypothetical protein
MARDGITSRIVRFLNGLTVHDLGIQARQR